MVVSPRDVGWINAQHPETGKVLRRKVMEYQEARAVMRRDIELDESSRERLRSLGYPAD